MHVLAGPLRPITGHQARHDTAMPTRFHEEVGVPIDVGRVSRVAQEAQGARELVDGDPKQRCFSDVAVLLAPRNSCLDQSHPSVGHTAVRVAPTTKEAWVAQVQCAIQHLWASSRVGQAVVSPPHHRHADPATVVGGVERSNRH